MHVGVDCLMFNYKVYLIISDRLPDFSDFAATFANNAANQLIRHGHLVGLVGGGWGSDRGCQQGQGRGVDQATPDSGATQAHGDTDFVMLKRKKSMK